MNWTTFAAACAFALALVAINNRYRIPLIAPAAPAATAG